ncbi:MAG: hypothetical protein Q4D51_04945 [Eubacteriales bacterium]|nr:hypothetical protein [Eubacteriales bacterium]
MTLNDENQESGLSFREEPIGDGLSFKEEPTPSGLSFKEDTSATDSSFQEEPTTSTYTAPESTSYEAEVPTAYAPEFDEPYVSSASTSAYASNITFKEFYKDYCSATTKKNINGSAITLYICSGITLIASILATALGVNIMAAALDAVLMLGLALGIHIGKSRVCAVIVLIYSLINCIYTMTQTGRPGGWLIIIAGAYATIATFSARKEYKEYIGK